MNYLVELIKSLGMTRDDVLIEAQCVEDYEEWIHSLLMGYGADELRQAADLL